MFYKLGKLTDKHTLKIVIGKTATANENDFELLPSFTLFCYVAKVFHA